MSYKNIQKIYSNVVTHLSASELIKIAGFIIVLPIEPENTNSLEIKIVNNCL